MGIKRIVDVGFWTDNKVVDMFSPEDKLFFLYLLTNPHTTQLGVYPINKRVMAFELGYSLEAVCVLIDRFQNKYKLIRYSEETGEVAIKNYLRHSIVKGGKPVEDLLVKEISRVKDKGLLSYVYQGIHTDENLIPTVNKILSLLNKNNDNDNEVTSHVTSNVTYHVTSEDFGRFWEVYPKKKGKGDAEKAFRKANVDVDVLINAVNRQKQSEDWLKEDGRFIPYPATWLNGRRWEDEPDKDKNNPSAGGLVAAALLRRKT